MSSHDWKRDVPKVKAGSLKTFRTCSRCGLVERSFGNEISKVYWGGRWQQVVPECSPRGQPGRR